MTPDTPNDATPSARTGNANALRNGSRARVALGCLPRRLARLGRGVAEYRRALEAAVETRHGCVTTEAAHHITLAAEAFQWGAIARWTMRQADTKPADMLRAAEAIVRAGERRNAAVARLDLAEPPPDPMAEYKQHIARAQAEHVARRLPAPPEED
jgi:hypothetical protein